MIHITKKPLSVGEVFKIREAMKKFAENREEEGYVPNATDSVVDDLLRDLADYNMGAHFIGHVGTTGFSIGLKLGFWTGMTSGIILSFVAFLISVIFL